MIYFKPNPVKSLDNIRDRVKNFFYRKTTKIKSDIPTQATLFEGGQSEQPASGPSSDIRYFVDFLCDAMPDGDIYLFGGILRDLALFGQKGFNSDIDIVIEGDWLNCVQYLQSLGGNKNKFGGYRLYIGGWPVDIWNARETWAIRNGYVSYNGIGSLVNTTVLNWDAILMDWRTKRLICKDSYIEELRNRYLHINLVDNPNPLGMAVRVFRHFSQKDPKKISVKAARYMTDCTRQFSLRELLSKEISSYGNSIIEYNVYAYFSDVDINKELRSKAGLVNSLILSELPLPNSVNSEVRD